MMVRTPYSNPPVVEAILDLRVRFPAGLDLDRLYSFKKLVEVEFPTVLPMQMMQVSFGPIATDGGPPTQAAESRNIGLRFANEKNNRVLIVQESGFTLSKLAPYSDWSDLRNDARPLWNLYREILAPSVVTRCAVRFINRIKIPESRVEIFDYFNLYPKLPDGMMQDIGGMLLQLQMPQSDLGASTAVINLALAPPDVPGHLAFLLDIDLFSDLPDAPPDSPEIWNLLEQFRTRKNELFEAFITDKTRGLFV